MLERTIVLPTFDNDGVALQGELDAILSEVLVLAQGYSSLPQHGTWLDNGKVYQDDSLRVVTTVDELTDRRIQKRLPAWCSQLRQLCLYTHVTDVVSDFIEPATSVPTRLLA